jgi:histidinol phosphatase-like PHP family hydrolase
MYKIETHLHTVYSSRCGHLDAQTLVSAYLEKGYHGIVVTDHFNRITCEYLDADYSRPTHAAELFLQGYRLLLEEGQRQGMRIYKGAEFRFDGSDNDYLVIGYPDELLYDPDTIFKEGLPAFSRRCRECGALIIQAHPYRGNCTPADPQHLDGVETLNRNPNWDNHNDWALEFARQHGLLQTSGSDCHKTYQIGNGGILSETLPETDAELIALLRCGNYTLI